PTPKLSIARYSSIAIPIRGNSDTAMPFPYPKIIDRTIFQHRHPNSWQFGHGNAVSLPQNYRSHNIPASPSTIRRDTALPSPHSG
ncbi:hypothetical protein, partial [Tychonema sp. BBK16]|uniref:hypothetical protein n=1 Tax=Tychonema sp. BBK16 TaxID=2699888 RepID=UPI0038D2E575